MQSFSYLETLDDLSAFLQTLKRSKNVRKGTQQTISINLVEFLLFNELLNICIYCIDIFSREGFRSLVNIRTDYKVGEEEIKILSDVFVPLSLCIEKLILASVSKHFSTCCWTTVLHLYYLCLSISHYAKGKRSDCLLPRGVFLFVIKIFYMIIIIPSVSVVTKTWF